MDKVFATEFKIRSIDRKFSDIRSDSIHDFSFDFNDDESITSQKRRSYLTEVNEDYDVQLILKDVTWINQSWTE